MMKSLTSIIYLKRRLYSLWMKEGTKFVDHLNTFNTLIVQLTSMEVKFEDEDKDITLLCSLPKSWDDLTNSGMIDQVLSISNNLQYQEEWQLDSGASHHMCSHRNWFISYQYVDEGVVFMGNGIHFKTIGVGSIRIRMFDGIVRELKDVRYVPELKSNLNSLGVLDSCGYKYIGQGGALTVSKGSLVVMKETKVLC
jgi:hypothetical protein